MTDQSNVQDFPLSNWANHLHRMNGGGLATIANCSNAFLSKAEPCLSVQYIAAPNVMEGFNPSSLRVQLLQFDASWLHASSLTFSQYWEMCLAGSPVPPAQVDEFHVNKLIEILRARVERVSLST